jgi:hypothetical protein
MSLLEKVEVLGNVDRRVSTAAFCRICGVNSFTSSTKQNKTGFKTSVAWCAPISCVSLLVEMEDPQK